MRKADLRRAMKARRAALSPEARAEASARAAAHVQAHPAWTRARTLGLYQAMPQELATASLIEAAWAAGKRVALPVTPPRGQPLIFRLVDQSTIYTSGPFGILEPGPDALAIPVGAMDLLLLPGLAFDARGARLGYGGGYYDRSLEAGPLCVMLAFACQELEAVPEGPHDRRVQAVVTEAGWRELG